MAGVALAMSSHREPKRDTLNPRPVRPRSGQPEPYHPSMTRTRGRWPASVAVVGALALTLAACDGAPPTAAPPSVASSTSATASDEADRTDAPSGAGITAEEAIALGEEMTAALASGDVEEWLSLTVLEGAAAQQQRDWFEGVQAVPMDVRELHPVFLANAAGEMGAEVEFSFRHQVTGVDAEPVVQPYVFTLVRADADWRVSQVEGPDDVDAAYPQLWDLGPISVIETEHLLVVTEASAGTRRTTEALETAAAATLTEFPLPGPDRMLVMLASAEPVSAMLGQGEGASFGGWITPASSPEVERDGILPDVEDGAPGPVRVVLDRGEIEGEFSWYPRLDGGSPSMRNIATTVALSQQSGPHASPTTWVYEGVALWFQSVGDPEVRDMAAGDYRWAFETGGLPDALPPARWWEFYEEEHLSQHFYRAGSVFEYVEAQHGLEVTVALGLDLSRLDYFTDGEEAIDLALRDHLGVGTEEFEAAWVEWVAHEFGDDGEDSPVADDARR